MGDMWHDDFEHGREAQSAAQIERTGSPWGEFALKVVGVILSLVVFVGIIYWFGFR